MQKVETVALIGCRNCHPSAEARTERMLYLVADSLKGGRRAQESTDSAQVVAAAACNCLPAALMIPNSAVVDTAAGIVLAQPPGSLLRDPCLPRSGIASTEGLHLAERELHQAGKEKHPHA